MTLPKTNKIISTAFTLVIFLVPTFAMAASVTLGWKKNKEADFSHYNIYYGTKSRSYGNPIPSGKSNYHVVSGLKQGVKYYFAITAVDTSGNESGFSSEVSKKATSTGTNKTHAIPLPASGNYGRIKGGGQITH